MWRRGRGWGCGRTGATYVMQWYAGNRANASRRMVVRFVPEGPTAGFLDAVEWFEGWLAPVVRRPLKAGTYWCGQWQEHAEAVERLRAVWEAWEAARAEGGNAMSDWWTVHFDAHWAAPTDSAGGPFSACARRGQHSTDLRGLPSDLEGAEE